MCPRETGIHATRAFIRATPVSFSSDVRPLVARNPTSPGPYVVGLALAG